jgi:hypothetical protein
MSAVSLTDERISDRLSDGDVSAKAFRRLNMAWNTTVRGCCGAFLVLAIPAICSSLSPEVPEVSAQAGKGIEYRVLATNKTSTMEKELNDAAEAGFRVRSAMGGETTFGGREVVVVTGRTPGTREHFAYKLLATTRTSTMSRELQEAADAGFEYKAQTVFRTAFGGSEVVVILERNRDAPAEPSEYRLVATSRTSTLEKELLAAGAEGYDVLAMTVAKTALGGEELVAITRRPKTR